MSAAIMQSVSDQDAAWFARHPFRNTRVRPFVEGEAPASMPCGDGVAAVIVRQVRPGVRLRVPAYVPKLPADTEKAAVALLRRLMPGAA